MQRNARAGETPLWGCSAVLSQCVSLVAMLQSLAASSLVFQCVPRCFSAFQR